jgi:hypothetical protein
MTHQERIKRWRALPWYDKIGAGIGLVIFGIFCVAISPIILIVWAIDCFESLNE